MCKPVIVEEHGKNAKKLSMKNVLNDQKYYEILQNLKFYILNPNYEVKSSNW